MSSPQERGLRQEHEVRHEISERSHGLECVVAALEKNVRSRETHTTPFIVRISGYSALGKSTLARQLADRLDAAVIQTDGYMLDRETRRARGLTNGDDPQTIDFEGMKAAIDLLASGESVHIPQYNHHTGRHETTSEVAPAAVIVIEGASALYSELQVSHPELKIFLDADESTKIRLRHDVNVLERGYTEEQFQQALPGYLAAYATYIQPSLANADLVLQVTQGWEYKVPFIQNCACPPV